MNENNNKYLRIREETNSRFRDQDDLLFEKYADRFNIVVGIK